MPILIKVSSINRLGREARRCRRAAIDQYLFKKVLIATVVLVLAYLIVWAVIDKPVQYDDFAVLIDTESGEHIVAVYSGCASKSYVWEILACGWEILLLLSTTVLTYQSREIMQQVYDSQWLSVMVYSHSTFLLMRVIVNSLMYSSMIPPAMSGKIVGILLGADTIAAIIIFFGPKFSTIVTKKKEPGPQIFQIKSSGRRSFISGINIPPGGIPNLIRQVQLEDDRSNVERSNAVKSVSSSKSHKSKAESSIYMGDDDDDDDAKGTGEYQEEALKLPDCKESSKRLRTSSMEEVEGVKTVGMSLREENHRLLRENYEHKRHTSTSKTTAESPAANESDPSYKFRVCVTGAHF